MLKTDTHFWYAQFEFSQTFSLFLAACLTCTKTAKSPPQSVSILPIVEKFVMASYSIYHDYDTLYNNQINAHALIGQLSVGYCAGKPTEKSSVFWIII